MSYRVALAKGKKAAVTGYVGRTPDGTLVIVESWSSAVEVDGITEADQIRRGAQARWPGTRPRIELVPVR